MTVTIMIFVILCFLALTAVHAKLGEINETLKSQSRPWPNREEL